MPNRIIALFLLLAAQEAQADCTRGVYRAGCTTPNGAVMAGAEWSRSRQSKRNAYDTAIRLLPRAQHNSSRDERHGLAGQQRDQGRAAGMRFRKWEAGVQLT